MTTLDDDVRITGTLTAGSLSVPASTVSDTQVAALANISALKLERSYNLDLPLFDHATDVVAVRKGIFRAESVCTIDAFGVWVSVAAGATTTYTVDLLKNGTTILTGTISFTSALTAFTDSEGTLSSSSLVAGDKLEVSVGITGSNEAKGLNCYLIIRERGY